MEESQLTVISVENRVTVNSKHRYAVFTIHRHAVPFEGTFPKNCLFWSVN
jgi:hypothetical protein